MTIRTLATLLLFATPPLAAQTRETAVLAGGCFWGVEAVFEHVKGVIDVVSGYSGGRKEDADYETVSSSTTGHAESVRISFDPSVVSYKTLLGVFFTVAHNPTELNRQGPDKGPQYRSVVFYTDERQRNAADGMIAAMTKVRRYANPIVTEVTPLIAFYEAEAEHQDYARYHPNAPYIVYHDAPKVEHLRLAFPELYQEATKR